MTEKTYVTTVKTGDVFRLTDTTGTVGTITIKRRKGQTQLVFALTALAVKKNTFPSQYEEKQCHIQQHD